MKFQKGHIPANKGKMGLYKASDETKRKQSESHKGRKPHSFTEETRRKMAEAKKGKHPWIAGKRHSDKSRAKMSEARMGVEPWNKGQEWTEEVKEKMAEAKAGKNRGDENPNWKGGKKASTARTHSREKQKGFTLISDKNPYEEPIDYHHVIKGLPYVVPCPRRIHQMFNGQEPTHWDNVNAMLGINFDELRSGL
ncbi:MAG: NUMOD3 domain-containing DNA-binding protein [Candidatus Methanoperedens sp.]|nr:NUMOD3 domain-containing DNA-binding protein [Candidatus Methanoperedens sp.]